MKILIFYFPSEESLLMISSPPPDQKFSPNYSSHSVMTYILPQKQTGYFVTDPCTPKLCESTEGVQFTWTAGSPLCRLPFPPLHNPMQWRVLTLPRVESQGSTLNYWFCLCRTGELQRTSLSEQINESHQIRRPTWCVQNPTLLQQKHSKVQVLFGWFGPFLNSWHVIFTVFFPSITQTYLRSKKSLAQSHKLGKNTVLACTWNCLLHGHKSRKLPSVSGQGNDFLGWDGRQKFYDLFAKFELKMFVVMAFCCLGYGRWVWVFCRTPSEMCLFL